MCSLLDHPLSAETQYEIKKICKHCYAYRQPVNPHQRCGYSNSPFARVYFSYTAGSTNIFEGMDSVCWHTKKHKTTSKRHFFLIQKCFEDARQDEKHVPDLLESIMRPNDPVKEELQQKLFIIAQFGSKIKKMRVSNFWIPEIQKFPAGGQCQPSH